MQRQFRLTGNKRFSTIRRDGQGRANRLLVLKGMPNDLDRSRIGFVVGKRVGCAVVRNRLKRRLREMIRCTPVKPGWDMCVIARRNAGGAGYDELKQAAQDLLKRASLLSNASDLKRASESLATAGPPSLQHKPRGEPDPAAPGSVVSSPNIRRPGE